MSTYDNTGLERGSSERPGRSAPTKNQPKRSAPSVISAHPASKGKPAGSRKAPGQRPDEPGSPPGQVEVSALSEAEKEAIQKRAEGRTKVPPRFRDSIKRFFFSPTGALKLLRLVSGESWWPWPLSPRKPSLLPVAGPRHPGFWGVVWFVFMDVDCWKY